MSLAEGGMPFELRQPKYNTETEAAMQEAREIIAGKRPAKRYASVQEAVRDALNEKS